MKERYPPCEKKDADAHCWVFKDKDTFEPYYCKFPDVKKDEVRAKVLHTGLCLSDSKNGRGSWGPRHRPCCTGHEVIARISEIGPDVKHRKIGDIVGVGVYRNSCGSCEYCEAGEDNLCTGMDGGERSLYKKYFGGYSTIIQIRETYTVIIPE